MNNLPPWWRHYSYCCLTHSSCVENFSVIGVNACRIRWQMYFICPCCHCVSYVMSRVSCRAHDMLPVYGSSVQTVCDIPARLLHWTIAWLTVPVLCMCCACVVHVLCMCLYFLCHVLCPEVSVTLFWWWSRILSISFEMAACPGICRIAWVCYGEKITEFRAACSVIWSIGAPYKGCQPFVTSVYRGLPSVLQCCLCFCCSDCSSVSCPPCSWTNPGCCFEKASSSRSPSAFIF